MRRNKKRFLAIFVAFALVFGMNLKPDIVLAADATIKYVNTMAVDGEGNPTSVELSDTKNEETTIGVFAYGSASDSYSVTQQVGFLFINNVAVTVENGGNVAGYKISGSGSLNMGNYTISTGNYSDAYSGNVADANAVFEFYASPTMGNAIYSYNFTNSDTLGSIGDAYDVTVASGKTLTLNTGLRIHHALDATGATITISGENLLTIEENATVTGMTLYDTNGQDTYTFTETHNAESFAYTNAGTGDNPDMRWVRQEPGGNEPQDPSDPQDPPSAPTVRFCVQNNSTTVGSVQYKIGNGNWTNANLTLGGEDPEHRRLEGSVSDTLALNNTIYIKAVPANGYEMDSNRGVKVNGNDLDASAVASIISTEGLSYDLTSNISYEFEFEFSEVQGGNDPVPQTAPTVSFRVQNIDAAVGSLQYKIGTGDWSNVSLNLEGQGGSQWLSGSVSQTLVQGNTLYIKAIPAEGYEIDTSRGVYVSINGGRSEVTNGTTSIISSDGLSYALSQNAPYEFEFGFQESHGGGQGEPGIDPGSGNLPVATAEQVKGAIDGRHWAYYGANSDSVKTLFETELWDKLSHELPGYFEGIDALTDAVTLSPSTSTDGSEFYISGTNPCPYYSFTVELGENDATGKIYVLASANDYVVCTKVNNISTFTITSGQDVKIVADYTSIGVFGNGVAILGARGSSTNYSAFHVEARVHPGAEAFLLTVYKPTFKGSQVTVPTTYTTPAWDFAQAKVAEFSSTPSTPAEFGVFYGNGSVTLSANSLGGDDISAITGVSTSLPNGAVTIVNNSGSYTITFNSNYYSEVPLTISYTDGSGAAKTGYLTLKRVGIDIQSYQKTGNSTTYNTNHGTEPGLSSKPWGSDSYVVYASYYYPETGTPSNDVDLYVTFTWPNNSITRQYITDAERTAANGDAVAIDDFVLYKGTEAGAPKTIEVTAVKSGTTDTSFAGVTLGSGAGVAWSR